MISFIEMILLIYNWCAGCTMGTLLIIDDNEAILNVAATMLEFLGHSVHQSISREDAVTWLESHKPDLVLMDWNMPGMSALEAKEAIRGISSAPIIICSGMSNEDNSLNASDFDGALNKPFKLEDVQEILDRHLQ